MWLFRIKDSYGRQEFFNLPFVADNLLKTDQSRIIKFIDQMNGIQVTNFHNRLTEPLNNYYRNYVRPQSSKQDDHSFRSILDLGLHKIRTVHGWIFPVKEDIRRAVPVATMQLVNTGTALLVSMLLRPCTVLILCSPRLDYPWLVGSN